MPPVVQLAADHLVQPVRFRELIERLHADGVRVFVQVGYGKLVGFIDDTLSTRPHLAITAAVATGDGTPRRSSRWRTGCATITTSAAMARVPIGPRAR